MLKFAPAENIVLTYNDLFHPYFESLADSVGSAQRYLIFGSFNRDTECSATISPNIFDLKTAREAVAKSLYLQMILMKGALHYGEEEFIIPGFLSGHTEESDLLSFIFEESKFIKNGKSAYFQVRLPRFEFVKSAFEVPRTEKIKL